MLRRDIGILLSRHTLALSKSGNYRRSASSGLTRKLDGSFHAALICVPQTGFLNLLPGSVTCWARAASPKSALALGVA